MPRKPKSSTRNGHVHVEYRPARVQVERNREVLDRRQANQDWLDYAHYVWTALRVFRPKCAARLAEKFWSYSWRERKQLADRARAGVLFRIAAPQPKHTRKK